MRRLVLGLTLPLAFMVTSVTAHASFEDLFRRKTPVNVSGAAVVAHVDVSTQTLDLTVNGMPYSSWKVSTAGTGYHTPRGTFHVQRLAKVWFSRKYDNSPMPNSVFFNGGIAIHGSYHLASLGRPASHGCVRLAPEHAAELFGLVQKYGASHTRIIVTD
jgi:lipoprotein-anchoring transpeptidase ErfK/SrfK